MAKDSNGEYYVPERSDRVTFAIEPAIRKWLYVEKRRRDRSMGWIINQALSQYMARVEKGRKSDGD